MRSQLCYFHGSYCAGIYCCLLYAISTMDKIPLRLSMPFLDRSLLGSQDVVSPCFLAISRALADVSILRNI